MPSKHHPITGIVCYLLLLVSFFTLSFVIPKGKEVTFFISLHHPFSDFLMQWLTKLAEWPFIILFFIFLIFTKDKKQILIAGLSLLILSFTIQGIKNLFPDYHRPYHYLVEAGIAYSPSWELFRIKSFPSGHTATGAALGLMIYFLYPGKKVLFFSISFIICVAITRLYLLQHYLWDVSAGLLLGLLFALPVLLIPTHTRNRNHG